MGDEKRWSGSGIRDLSFKEESYHYFRRNYVDVDITSIPPNPLLKKALRSSVLELDKQKVLEVGCGSGQNLNWLTREFGCKCTGIEPNEDVVEKLRGVFPNIEFLVGTADRLEFDSEQFDLVLLRSVLHWVSRNFVLQALGEAVRCTSKWLVISDFCPSSPFKTPYSHRPGLFTFHID